MVAAARGGEVGALDHAAHLELRDGERAVEQGAERVGAVLGHQLGGVATLRQADDEQLEVAILGHPPGAQHRLLAGAIGVEREVGH